jgi:hypothetical protein
VGVLRSALELPQDVVLGIQEWLWRPMEAGMRHSIVWIRLGLAALPIIAGCEQGPVNPDRCNIRLAIVTPDPATLAVGQEVTLDPQLTSARDCLPADARPGSLRWASDDPAVATINPVSGRVTAVSAGTTGISLTTATTHTLLTTSTIQVTP